MVSVFEEVKNATGLDIPEVLHSRAESKPGDREELP